MRTLLFASLLVGGLIIPSPASAELRVVAATTDLGAIARAVGGDHIQLDVVARPDRDPHVMEVRPSKMRKTAKADLYLEVGFDLDQWSDAIVRGSRNRNLVVVDCSEGIDPLQVPTQVDASQGDVHPHGNPHYWLDPVRAVQVAQNLARAFAASDPERGEEYAAAAARFGAELQARERSWRNQLAGGRFVEFHRTWVYFADRFGLEISGEIEPLPGIPPSAKHLAYLADVVRDEEVAVVVRDAYHPKSPVDFLVRETGVRAAVLPSSSAEATPEAYFALLDQAVAVLGADAD